MTIERTAEEIIIRISSSMNVDDTQQLIDYLTYKQITQKAKLLKKRLICWFLLSNRDVGRYVVMPL